MSNPQQKSLGNRFAIIAFLLSCILLFFYAKGYFDKRYNPNQEKTFLNKELILGISDDGHFRASGKINNVPVTFLIDTGASSIAISEEIAKKAGLKAISKIKSATANGTTSAHTTTIDQLSIAGMNFKDEPAVILPNMDNEALLGMSFLKQTNAEFKNNQLIIRINEEQ